MMSSQPYGSHIFQINMTVVLDYQPGRAIPQITMEIKCKVESPVEKYVTVKLRGVHEPTSLQLKCTHSTGKSTFLFMLVFTTLSQTQ